MSSALEAKALKIRFPNDTGRTAEDYGVKKEAVTTSHGQVELTPRADYSGRYVTLKFIGTAEGDLCHVGGSKVTGREVDATEAAPTNNKVGWPITHGETVVFRLPDWKHSDTFYLIHVGSAAGTLFIGISDG